MGQQILVVEDEDLVREFMVEVLHELKFEILEAATAEEALEILAKFQNVALMVADVELAGTMTGLELIQRARDAYPAMRSFVVSGKGTPIGACQAGANGFLPKPFTAEMLASIVSVGILHRKL